jgi:hypothetical protein
MVGEGRAPDPSAVKVNVAVLSVTAVFVGMDVVTTFRPMNPRLLDLW